MGYHQGIHKVSHSLPLGHFESEHLLDGGGRSRTMLIHGTSLTPLRANYMQASGVPYGELKL